MANQNKKKSFLIIASVLLLVILIIGAFILPSVYKKYFKANVNVTQKTFLYINIFFIQYIILYEKISDNWIL